MAVRNHALIRALKDQLALLDETLKLIGERDWYRAIAQQSIHRSHETHLQIARLRASHEHLLNEYRRLRERGVMTAHRDGV